MKAMIGTDIEERVRRMPLHGMGQQLSLSLRLEQLKKYVSEEDIAEGTEKGC